MIVTIYKDSKILNIDSLDKVVIRDDNNNPVYLFVKTGDSTVIMGANEVGFLDGLKAFNIEHKDFSIENAK